MARTKTCAGIHPVDKPKMERKKKKEEKSKEKRRWLIKEREGEKKIGFEGFAPNTSTVHVLGLKVDPPPEVISYQMQVSPLQNGNAVWQN